MNKKCRLSKKVFLTLLAGSMFISTPVWAKTITLTKDTTMDGSLIKDYSMVNLGTYTLTLNGTQVSPWSMSGEFVGTGVLSIMGDMNSTANVSSTMVIANDKTFMANSGSYSGVIYGQEQNVLLSFSNSSITNSMVGGYTSTNNVILRRNMVELKNNATVNGDVSGAKAEESLDNVANYNKVEIDEGASVGSEEEDRNIYGAYLQDGVANGNSVIVDGGKTYGFVYGAKVDGTDGVANSNKVTIGGGAVESDVYGGYLTSADNVNTMTKNVIVISGGTVGKIEDLSTVIAGYSAGSGKVKNNSITVSDGNVYGNLSTGYSESGTSMLNKVTISGGNFSGSIMGGQSGSNGSVNSNSVTVKGGTFGSTSSVIGGYGQGNALTQLNTVSISNGNFVVGSKIIGGYSESGKVVGNEIIISGGSIAGDVFGGYSESGDVSGNIIRFNSGSISGKVIGGYSENGNVTNNLIYIKDSTLSGDFYAGYAVNGTASNNDIYIDGSVAAEGARFHKDYKGPSLSALVISTDTAWTQQQAEEALAGKNEVYVKDAVLTLNNDDTSAWNMGFSVIQNNSAADSTLKFIGAGFGVHQQDVELNTSTIQFVNTYADINVASIGSKVSEIVVNSTGQTKVYNLVDYTLNANVTGTNTLSIESENGKSITLGSGKTISTAIDIMKDVDKSSGELQGQGSLKVNANQFTGTADIKNAGVLTLTGGTLNRNIVAGTVRKLAGEDVDSTTTAKGEVYVTAPLTVANGVSITADIYGVRESGNKDISGEIVNITNGIITGGIAGGYVATSGKNSTAKVTDNSVVINSSRDVGNQQTAKITGGIRGGVGELGDVTGNSITLNNGYYYYSAKGIWGGEGEGKVANNEVAICAGTFFNTSIYGGYTDSGYVDGNKVIITPESPDYGETVIYNGADIVGGYAKLDGNASNNEVSITDAKIGGTSGLDTHNGSISIVGGKTANGNAASNIVRLIGVGLYANVVVGGYASGIGSTANNNEVHIDGGIYRNVDNNHTFIKGGRAHTEAVGNIVEIKNATVALEQITGASVEDDNGIVSGNKVIIDNVVFSYDAINEWGTYGTVMSGARGGVKENNSLEVGTSGFTINTGKYLTIQNFDSMTLAEGSTVTNNGTLTIGDNGDDFVWNADIGGSGKVNVTGTLTVDEGTTVSTVGGTFSAPVYNKGTINLGNGSVIAKQLLSKQTGSDTVNITGTVTENGVESGKYAIGASILNVTGGTVNSDNNRSLRAFTTTITDSVVNTNVMGLWHNESATKEVYDNILTITNSTLSSNATAGQNSTYQETIGNVYNNSVSVSGSTVASIEGAYNVIYDSTVLAKAYSAGDVYDNSVVIKDNSTVNGDVYGGESFIQTSGSSSAYLSQHTSGDVYNNSVTVTGSAVYGVIYGGYSSNGLIHDNTVTLNNVILHNNVYGGDTTNDNNAYSNYVNLNGVTVGVGGSYSVLASTNNKQTQGGMVEVKEGGLVNNGTLRLGGGKVLVTGNITGTGDLTISSNTGENNAQITQNSLTVTSVLTTAFDNIHVNTFKNNGTIYGSGTLCQNLDGSGKIVITAPLIIGNNVNVSNTIYGGAEYSKITVSGTAVVNNNIYGGYSEDEEVIWNTVTVYGGTINDAVYGGYTEEGMLRSNKVIISDGGEIFGNIYGAYAVQDDVLFNENKVVIDSGSIHGDVYGGYGDKTHVYLNSIEFNSGNISGDVYGGYSGADSVSGNSVTIVDGTFNNNVYGGYSDSEYRPSTVYENRVTISGGTVDNNVYGGYNNYTNAYYSYDDSVRDNVVAVTGGIINGNVYGGYALRNKVQGNSVYVDGVDVSINTDVYGGYSVNGSSVNNKVVWKQGNIEGILYGGKGNTSTNNTLAVYDAAVKKSVTVGTGSVQNIEFYLNDTTDLGITNAVLTLNNAFTLNEANNKICVYTSDGSTQSEIEAGSNITLLYTGVNALSLAGVTYYVDGEKIAANKFDKFFTIDDNSLVFVMPVISVDIVPEGATYNTIYMKSTTEVTVNGKAVTELPEDDTGWGNVIGGYSEYEDVKFNSVYIQGGTIEGKVYGGKSIENNVQSNQVNISGTAFLNNDIYGGYSKNDQVVENTVRAYGGTINGDIYGGYIVRGMILDNKVNISGADIFGSVYGAYAEIENAITFYENKVIIDSGNIYGNIYGGYGEKVHVSSNCVKINNGTTVGNVYGGCSEINSVYSNSVTIGGGSITGNVYGGYSECSRSREIYSNSVIISSGIIAGDIYGGYSLFGNVTGNTVTIDGGSISGNLFGGYSESGDVSNNKVYVNGGNIVGKVIGGYSDAGNVTGNEVWIANNTIVTGDIYGGYTVDGEVSDNQIYVDGWAQTDEGKFHNNYIGEHLMEYGVGVLKIGKTITNDTINAKVGFITIVDCLVDYSKIMCSREADCCEGNRLNVISSVVLDTEIYGAYSENKHVKNNSLILIDSQFAGNSGCNLCGGYASGAYSSSNNILVINGGTISGCGYVCGGHSWSNGGQSSYNITQSNELVINNSSVGSKVYGGYSRGDAVNNIVRIYDSTIDDKVYGGYSHLSASSNCVYINGGIINGTVYGGYSENGSSCGNSVIITGGTVAGNVYGGNNVPKDNRVVWKDGFIQGCIRVGYGPGFGVDYSVNNTLVLYDAETKKSAEVDGESVQNLVFYLNDTTNTTDSILTLSDDFIFNKTNSKIYVYTSDGETDCGIAVGDSITLLSVGTHSLTMDNITYYVDGEKIADSDVDSYFTLGTNTLVFKMIDVSVNLIPSSSTSNTVVVTDTQNVTVNGIAPTKFPRGDDGWGDVLGGYSESEIVTENKVMIGGGKIDGNVYGGKSTISANAVLNKVTIDGGNVIGKVYGGQSANSESNQVIITNGTIGDDVYGGDSKGYYAILNKVTIKGNSNIGGNVYGGYSYYGPVGTKNAGTYSGNEVLISGGTFYGDIYGGCSALGDVANNKVTISHGTISGNVYGGYSSSGNVTNNTVNITGGTISGYVYGGYTQTGIVNGNTVTVSGTAVVDKAKIYQNYKEGASNTSLADEEALLSVPLMMASAPKMMMSAPKLTSAAPAPTSVEQNQETETQEEMIVLTDTSEEQIQLQGEMPILTTALPTPVLTTSTPKSGTFSFSTDATGQKAVGLLDGFATIEYKDVTWNNGATILKINDWAGSTIDGSNIDLSNINLTGGSQIKAGDTMKLINSEDAASVADLPVVEDIVIDTQAGIAQLVTLQPKPDTLELKVTKAEFTPQTLTIGETSAVAAAFINQGHDMVEQGIQQIATAPEGMEVFAGMNTNKSKYETGSHVDIKGHSIIAGTAKTLNNGLSYGIFYEQGNADYDTYADAAHGEGKANYKGAGIIITKKQKNGFYTEGSLRTGKLNNQLRNGIQDHLNNSLTYDFNTFYYGGHIGLGRKLNIGNNNELDIYGKYIYAHNNGTNFVLDGDRFKLNDVNSHRVKFGARINRNFNNKFTFYYGASYEYGFNGDINSSVNGMELKKHSIGGGTAIFEIGTKLISSSKWDLDFNMKGFLGQRRGGTFSLQAAYKF